MNPRTTVWYLGLGANLGRPLEQLDRGLELLREAGLAPSRISSVVASPPWDGSDQPDYLNLACRVETAFPPRDILAATQAIERRVGRPAARERWAPRVLDIDLLLGEGVILDEPGLTVPHPQYCERLFVLQPLAEIAPALVDPRTGEVVDALLHRLLERERPLRIVRAGGQIA